MAASCMNQQDTFSLSSSHYSSSYFLLAEQVLRVPTLWQCLDATTLVALACAHHALHDAIVQGGEVSRRRHEFANIAKRIPQLLPLGDTTYDSANIQQALTLRQQAVRLVFAAGPLNHASSLTHTSHSQSSLQQQQRINAVAHIWFQEERLQLTLHRHNQVLTLGMLPPIFYVSSHNVDGRNPQQRQQQESSTRQSSKNNNASSLSQHHSRHDASLVNILPSILQQLALLSEQHVGKDNTLWGCPHTFHGKLVSSMAVGDMRALLLLVLRFSTNQQQQQHNDSDNQHQHQHAIQDDPVRRLARECVMKNPYALGVMHYMLQCLDDLHTHHGCGGGNEYSQDNRA